MLFYRRRKSEWWKVKECTICFSFASLPKTCPNHTLPVHNSVSSRCKFVAFCLPLFALFHAHFLCEAHKRFHIRYARDTKDWGDEESVCAFSSCTGQLQIEENWKKAKRESRCRSRNDEGETRNHLWKTQLAPTRRQWIQRHANFVFALFFSSHFTSSALPMQNMCACVTEHIFFLFSISNSTCLLCVYGIE